MFDSISQFLDMLKQGGLAGQAGPTDGSIPIPTANPNGPGLPAPMAQQVDPTTTGGTAPNTGVGLLAGAGQAIGTNDGKGGASTFGGLLNFKSDDNKQAFLRGLLSASGSMLQAGAPSDHPQSLGGAVGGALQAGTGAYDGYGQNKAQLAKAGADTLKATAAANADLYKTSQEQQADQARLQYLKSLGGVGSFNGGSNAGATNAPVDASAVGGVLGSGATPAQTAQAGNGDAGQFGYTMDKLKKIYAYNIAIKNDAGANDALGMIQKLQQQGASQGLIAGPNGFAVAPGYAEGLGTIKQAEATGTSIGNRKEWTNDQKELAAINEENAANGKPALALSDYLAAKRPDGATGDMKNLVVINQQRVAAGQPSLSLEQYQESQKPNTTVTSDGKGGVTVTQGVGKSGAGLNEGQTASATFYARARNALANYDKSGGDDALNSAAGYATNGVPIMGPVVTSEGYQLANNSKQEMIRALLRKESGAAIGKDEYRSADQTYFPQPNDPPAVIKQKKDMREQAIKTLKIGVPDSVISSIDGSGKQGAPSGTVTTKADYDALPSGAVFTRNGKQFRKP
ncbi:MULTISPECIES: hypothetical protein [unclassified Rhizobium]|uniref:hypothetical protein n=1 Tax=unclassified Rhizobium TaxID=2613769 RepID=UPI0011604B71|nr:MULTISPECIES: hypothetical protein [unclassified Rhizobium]TQX87147.1 hypothetical protein EQW76_14910 [Rhizobium sp. rho-13.1]TQY14230.1 hypothetical protein EQW74_13710 [Rhizobium sp. rho-1.1]